MLFSMSTVTRPTRPRPLTLPQIETGRAEAKFSSAKCSEPVPVWAINQHSTAQYSVAECSRLVERGSRNAYMAYVT